MFHYPYPSKHDCQRHEEIKTLDISSSKVMQIDSTPGACQMHPAGTPKGQGQYYIYYMVEKNICCYVEKEQIFGKTKHVFLERRRSKLQSPIMLIFTQGKSILRYRLSSW